MCRIYRAKTGDYVRVCKSYGGPLRVSLTSLSSEALEHLKRYGHLPKRLRCGYGNRTTHQTVARKQSRFRLHFCRVCGNPTRDEICDVCKELCRKHDLGPSGVAELLIASGMVCRRCGKPSTRGRICGRCRIEREAWHE
ncbi:hypothetical protein [Thermosulfurimonas sp. F29]|uniref:hypothetical protein n=1 Tax=Thermosulfurimonas sp. F29 TaxID=2867247 RepID=UPI001C83FE83|nr:hypothetical protein [Thermosulfurimonas sp. F29]MBX6424136.1 hypothetical protein [Thermosulfurimonas sp. F29]